MFTCHGYPMSIQTDNVFQFTSEHFVNYMKEIGMAHRINTPLWSQANGEVNYKTVQL